MDLLVICSQRLKIGQRGLTNHVKLSYQDRSAGGGLRLQVCPAADQRELSQEGENVDS